MFAYVNQSKLTDILIASGKPFIKKKKWAGSSGDQDES